jgi:ATP-dependent HslUV protease ATP-binding subunit HslU
MPAHQIEAVGVVALVNDSVENIWARRLQTIMERVLDEISFSASERQGDKLVVDAAYVRTRVEDLAKDQDLSRFIL